MKLVPLRDRDVRAAREHIDQETHARRTASLLVRQLAGEG